jgi:hypothetical protein
MRRIIEKIRHAFPQRLNLIREHVDAQTLRSEFAGLCKFHDFQDDLVGQGAVPSAVEVQDLTNSPEGCSHCFDMFRIYVVL